MKHLFKFTVLVFLGTFMISCEDYFGEKTDLGFIEVPEADYREIAYVPIQPAITSFSRPVDICIGFDELLYIVDENTEEVIAMDEAGRIIGRKKIEGARAVVQDRRFDLLVIGSSDTVLTNGGPITTFTAIYRLRMIGNNGYGLNDAQIIKKIVHPFYYQSTASNSHSADFVRFNRIGIIGSNNPQRNNEYYVTRSGPVSSTIRIDDAVVWFDNNDKFISTVTVNTSSGLFRDYFEDPHGITTMTQPPQFTAETGGDFLYTSLDSSKALQVQYIEFIESEFGAEFRPRILESGGDTSKADDFINRPGRFEKPYDITIAGDASRYIFVVDGKTDSIYQFTSTGFEGVLPPAATGITKFQKASFGGTGNGLTQFDEPRAVAYFNEILYVADAGNGRILRFKLTTDFD